MTDILPKIFHNDKFITNYRKSEFIDFKDRQPPDDYEYGCFVVFKDGWGTKSDGGTVHDCCKNSGTAKGWREIIID